jgi:WD40 repeat protein
VLFALVSSLSSSYGRLPASFISHKTAFRWSLCIAVVGILLLAPPGLAANDRVVYLDNNILWTADSQGGNREQVTDSENRIFTDDQSPDGTTAVVAGFFHGASGLSLVNLQTHMRTQIYTGEAARPRFSPDGKKVTFDTSGSEADIKTINTDGTGLTSIITWKGAQEDPDFSPDGSKITFDSNTNSHGKSLGENGPQLFVTNANGSNPIQVTKTSTAMVWAEDPSFSPTGTTLAFRGENSSGHFVFTVSTSGTNQTQINTGGNGGVPSWSPDGSTILFQTNRNKSGVNYDLYTVPSTGGAEHAFITDPTFSLEDGRYREPSSTCQSFCALAHRFEPVLRFDTSEKWRPLNVEQFFEEKRQYLCDTKTGCETVPLTNIAGLNKDRASTAYVQVAGEGDVEESYHSPYSECTSGGLLDCDSGTRSAIYYRSPGVYGGYEYIDYWFFYRANHYSGEIDFHQGDWENVTVAPSLTTDSFDYAAFSQHGTDYAYARGVLRCEGSPGSEIPAAGTCSSTSDRIDDMVAYGSHADYTTPCSQKLPTDCRNNNDFLPSEFENGYDGQKRWGRAWEPEALLQMPAAGTNSWVDWPGKWGSPKSLPEGEGPASPANQGFKVECATINNEPGCETGPRTSSVRNPLGVISSHSVRVPGLSAVSCANWAGPGIAAVACNPKDLRRAVLAGDVGTSPAMNLTVAGRHSANGGGRGVAQVARTSGLRNGSELTISGAVTAETKILARVYDRVSKHELLGMFHIGATRRAHTAGTTKLHLRVKIHRNREGRVSLSLGRIHAKAIALVG